MQIYVSNIDLHVGDWLELPMYEDDLKEELKKIGGNTQQIHDYDLPFDVSQYDDILKVNELCNYIEDNNIDHDIVTHVCSNACGDIYHKLSISLILSKSLKFKDKKQLH